MLYGNHGGICGVLDQSLENNGFYSLIKDPSDLTD